MAETVLYSERSAPGAVLAVFDRTGCAGVYPLGPAATIGRLTAGGGCDVPIASRVVSRAHGRIVRFDGSYRYLDTDSTNGTCINGRLIGKAAPDGQRTAELKNGDVLSFDLQNTARPGPERVIALFSTTLSPSCVWRELPLDERVAEVLIGRSRAAGLHIDDAAISERHASFFHAAGGWAIIDHDSKNGVFLNGTRVTAPRYLRELDVIRIADTFFVFLDERLLYSSGTSAAASQEGAAPAAADRPAQDTGAPERGELVIHIVERSVVRRLGRMALLQDIDLSISRGEMVLILGGSGAGKTTFLNAVMGYEKAEGTILYRDTDIYEEYERMKYEIGFVPQQDLLRGSDTVYDTLANAAEMKLPRRIGAEKREERIQTVLGRLGLSRERDSLVSKLSGGQRKRLSIAVELIADPSLFFLDEPDSGVDDVMGRGLMENLRKIADSGKIVMLITHSPERAADLFDKVLVLAKSAVDNCGHMAFFGTPEEAFRFFEAGSFREIVRKINRPDENGEGLSDHFIEKYRLLTGGGLRRG